MDFSKLVDVEPIPQNDGPNPVCTITYPSEFVYAYDYLRALLKADERSARALELTTACLELNPANYTVWHFRRRCLVALSNSSPSSESSDEQDDVNSATIDVVRMEEDLEFADKLGGSNPKNYQIWYHRRALLEYRFKGRDELDDAVALQVAKTELEYVDKILGDDSKNYHAWSHRQWIIRTLNNPELWSSEIEYSHSKVLSDPRNNSAWNQRWFALHEGKVSNAAASKGSSVLSFDKAKEEAHYALSGAKVDPYNESPWRYLIGVLMEQWRLVQRGGEDTTVADINEVTNLIRESIVSIREMKKSLEEQPSTTEHSTGPSVSLLSALVDLLELFTDEKDMLVEAKNKCGELILEDPVRRKYWLKRQKTIAKLLEKTA